jgi:gas vesicle protein
MKAFGKFLAGFILGGILGSILAILFAPVSGNELRGRIEDNFYHVRNEVETAAKQRSEELKKELAKLQKKETA